MKTKNKKGQTRQLQHRSLEARCGAIALVLATVFALADSGRQTAFLVREAHLQPAFALNSAAENEVVRIPVKFDEGVRAPVVTGW